jgi:tripartite-type tricarboxylate transporter receptor subunit TctC
LKQTGFDRMISAMRALCAIAIAAQTSLVVQAPAQTGEASNYPARSITFIVPGPVAGSTDTLCRVVADKLRRTFGKVVVVENRAGGVGSIGASAAAVARPDGHTLLCTPDAPIVLSPLVNRNLPYDAYAFEPVIALAVTYSVIALRRDFPENSVAKFIAHARANPGKLNYASGGNGSGSHVATRQFECLAGIEMVNIPYPGSGPSQRALVGGEVDVLIDSLPVLLPASRAGLVKIVAIAAPSRLAEMPDVPTFADAGLGQIELVNWFGILAPPRTASSIIAKLNQAINDVLALPDVGARLDALTLRPAAGTPEAFAEFIARDRKQREAAISRQHRIQSASGGFECDMLSGPN